MTLTRRDRLQALGLWPLWRLRAPLASSPDVVNSQDEAAAEFGEIEPIAVPEPRISLRSILAAEPLYSAEATNSPTSAPIPSLTTTTPISAMDWPALNAAIQACTCCELAKSRTRAVPGAGDLHADWMFIGEAPGANEDRQGEPFVGDAGILLDAILAAIGLARDKNVFIANVLKSRPPGNRDPLPAEVAACLPYLERQIELIQPKLIIALGRFAAQNLLVTDSAIGKLRGQVHRYRGVPLIVTYHPAYLLRNPLDKAKVWEDLVLARDTMNELKK